MDLKLTQIGMSDLQDILSKCGDCKNHIIKNTPGYPFSDDDIILLKWFLLIIKGQQS